MKPPFFRQTVLPLLAAFIWGTAFVAQSVGADYIGPFGFNALRSVIAFFFLLAVCLLLRAVHKRRGEPLPALRGAYRLQLLLGGLCCGLALTVSSNLQQKGLETTTAGKAGFITALYCVLVPIAGLFLHKRSSRLMFFSLPLAVAGLYCLCITEDFSFAIGDFYIFLCAICFTGHILVVDHFVQKVDGVELSCVQFLAVTLLSGGCALLFEGVPSTEALLTCAFPLLYLGLFSSGIAYTLQIIAQKGTNPTVVSLLLCLESVFATLAGAVILHDSLSGREYFGCVLMLAAVLLSQLPDPKWLRRKEAN